MMHPSQRDNLILFHLPNVELLAKRLQRLVRRSSSIEEVCGALANRCPAPDPYRSKNSPKAMKLAG